MGTENLLGVAPMGPDGAPRGLFHVGVLVGGASYCRSAQSDKLRVNLVELVAPGPEQLQYAISDCEKGRVVNRAGTSYK